MDNADLIEAINLLTDKINELTNELIDSRVKMSDQNRTLIKTIDELTETLSKR